MEKEIKSSLVDYYRKSKVGQTVGTVSDFASNYDDMRDANTIGADKYFHCKANCEASKRGENGQKAAEVLSDARETFDQKVKGDKPAASVEDQKANKYGRDSHKNHESCSDTCYPYRPNGLDLKF